MEKVYFLEQACYMATSGDRFKTDPYKTEEGAKKKLSEVIEELIQEEEAEIVFGSLENGFVKLRDAYDNTYELSVEERIVLD